MFTLLLPFTHAMLIGNYDPHNPGNYTKKIDVKNYLQEN